MEGRGELERERDRYLIAGREYYIARKVGCANVALFGGEERVFGNFTEGDLRSDLRFVGASSRGT